jgi:hypothetical protein
MEKGRQILSMRSRWKCPKAGFGISSIELRGFTTTMLINNIDRYCRGIKADQANNTITGNITVLYHPCLNSLK